MRDRQKALRRLWVGECTVCVRSALPDTDPVTGRTMWQEEAVVFKERCRLSYDRLSETQPDSGAARVVQTVKLFVDPSVVIPPGSKIMVTQHGVTRFFAQSGEPAVYTYHKEVPLVLFEGWA